MKSLALFLGAFSVGLGLVELLAPGSLGSFLGTRRYGRIRAYGVREIASGLGIFARPTRPGPLVNRVAGDAIDLASLAPLLAKKRKRANVAFAIGSVAAVTALDVIAARKNA